MLVRRLAAVFVVLLLAACSSGGGGEANRSSSSATASSESSSTEPPTSTESVQPGKTTFGADEDDGIIRSAVTDVERYYSEVFPTLYQQPFAPVNGGLFPYGPDDPPPACGEPGPAAYQDVAQNAFYCPQGDFVAWDSVNLTNQLLDEFGSFTLAIVVAHELGHAIEARHGILDTGLPTFVTEQQADCFAGAYTADVADGNSDTFNISLGDLDNALGGFLQIRDPVGTDTVSDTSAHGSAFQRINAFEDGLNGGPNTCAGYEQAAFNFVPEVFDPGSLDAAESGNLPYDVLEPLVIANLEGFWSAAFPLIGNAGWVPATINAFDPEHGVECGDQSEQGDDAIGLAFYCSDNDTLNWDDVALMPTVHQKIGDLAAAVIIANEYSARAQDFAGLEINTLDASLQGDCFTGVWVATTKTDEINDTLPEDAQLGLSPGDLDEAVAAFIQFGDNASDVESGAASSGTPFQHLDAFRQGFFDALNNGARSGISGCIT
jgi:predicted metalloprotease